MGYDLRDRVLSGFDAQPGGGAGFEIATAALDASYRLPLGVALRLRLPAAWKRFREPGSPEVAVAGPGDPELAVTWIPHDGESWSVVVGAGLALPLGATSAQPLAGAALPTPLQLGTGTFDPIFLAGLSARAGEPLRFALHAEARPVIYANRFGYQAANFAGAALGADYRVPGDFLVLGLDAEAAFTGRARVAGAEIANTERVAVYLVPRIGLRLPAGLRAELTLHWPLFQYAGAAQLGETLQGELRIGWTSPPLLTPGEP